MSVDECRVVGDCLTEECTRTLRVAVGDLDRAAEKIGGNAHGVVPLTDVWPAPEVRLPRAAMGFRGGSPWGIQEKPVG